MVDVRTAWAAVEHGLIVSCQAFPGEPLYGPSHMLAMARSAVLGGAVGIRANGPDDVAAIAGAIDVPLIGLYKADIPGFDVRITPTLAHVQAIVDAGADMVALDATKRPRPDGKSLDDAIAVVRRHADVAVLADVSSVDEGLAAEAAGADAVSTTLSGYTDGASDVNGPDLQLVERLASRLQVPLFAEGRYADPEDVRQAFEAGAFAVVIGAAITRPQWITERFVRATRRQRA